MLGSERNPEDIFHQASEISDPKKRNAYLDGACGGNEKLRAEVEALLLSDEQAGDFLEVPAFDPDVTLDSSPISEGPGTVIGRYKLLEQIGEGGFGVVYMAEQTKPINRRVALKIIKLGMDTKSVIARFEAERQALAMMDHPNIAKVFDAGATDTGRPYFVMELVKGVSITEYCDNNKLNTQERLDLFIQVCNAVQHAHQKGIIHRDIKPTNVMVTLHDDKAVPKVIDFGIAKATSQRLTEKTLFTRHAQMIGTPEYMSPEQAGTMGQDIDTRTDIYSLGVLLYELLTGTTPFDARELREAGYGEIQRIIQEKEPLTPSTRLSAMGEDLTGVAEDRKTNPDMLRKSVKGDLDWIVMKTLEKNRDRRYETANALAADIRRHLSLEPVEASPPSTIYRIRKFVRRKRALVTGVAAVLVVLVGGIVATTIFAIGQARARAEADDLRVQAEEEAEAHRRALYFNRIALANAEYNADNIARVRELLVLCAADLRGWEWYRLWYLVDQSRMTFRTHTKYVRAVSFSPDGERIISGSKDDTIKVWEVATGAEMMTLEGHTGEVTSVAFSPDGERIASGSLDNTVKLWDAATGACVMTLEARSKAANATSFREFLDKANTDLWNSDRGVEISGRSAGARTRSIRAIFKGVYSVSFSPNGKRLVSGGYDQGALITVWDAETGVEVMTIRGHRYEVTSVSFSPDGKQIVSGSEDFTVKVWEAATGAELMIPRGHQSSVSSVAFSPDGSRIVSGSADMTVKVWDAGNGSKMMTLRGHKGGVLSVAFCPDGKQIISGSSDGTIKVWDAKTGAEVWTLQGHDGTIYSVQVSPDGKYIVSGSRDKTVKVWNLPTGPGATTLRGHTGQVGCVLFSPDGRQVVSGGWDATIKIWDTATGDELMTMRGHEHCINSVAFSPDGKHIVSGSRDKTIKIWDANSGVELMILREHSGGIIFASFSPDGKRIISGSNDNTVKIWDAEDGNCVKSFDWPCQDVKCASLSPDRRRIVSGSRDGAIKVWDAEAGKELMTLRGHEKLIWSVAFSPNGRNIVSGGDDETVKVWDAVTGAELMTLSGHSRQILSVAYSPDGKRIISASSDNAMKLWGAETGAEAMTLHGGRRSISFSPDGTRIVSSNINALLGTGPSLDVDSVILIWDAASPEEVTTQMQ